MKLNVGRALTTAWNMWKTDWDLLLRVAGLFVFLPQFASLLLIPTAPGMPAGQSDETTVRAWVDGVADWFGTYGPWLMGAEVLTLFGSLVILMLYLGGDRPPLAEAMQTALRLFPRYFLAALLVSVPAGFILFPLIGVILVVPVLYLFGRLLLTGATIVADQPIGVMAALRRSIDLTRGNGLVMMAIAGLMLFGGELAAMPFLAAGQALGGAALANPVAAALLDALAAGALTVTAVAAILVRITLYREVAAGKRGI